MITECSPRGHPRQCRLLLGLLERVAGRVGKSVPSLVREFVEVGEWRLAVEWLADALADAHALVSTDELDELWALARLVDTEPQVASAIARGQLGSSTNQR